MSGTPLLPPGYSMLHALMSSVLLTVILCGLCEAASASTRSAFVWTRFINGLPLIYGRSVDFREAVKTTRHSHRGSSWMSSVDFL